MKITFVRLTKSNIDKVSKIKVSKEQSKYIYPVKNTIKLGLKKSEKDINYYLRCVKYKNNHVGIFLLCLNEKPYMNSSDNYRPGALLSRLMIDKKYQHLGIGDFVLKEVIKYVKSLGYKHLYATCVLGEKSPIHFFEKRGFKKTGKKLWDEEEEIVLKL